MDFSQITILLVVAAFLGILAKVFRQPLLVGYLFAGMILSLFGVIKDPASLQGLSQLGVTLLLFLLGLEMNLGGIGSFGRVAVVSGLGQIFFTSLLGLAIALLLGHQFLPALYIAICLAFSSTIIIVKLLSEKKDLSSLYGRISIGFLLVQDLVAIVILMFLAGLGKDNITFNSILVIAVKGIVLFTAILFLSRKILPNIFEKIIATSTELTFIVSIGWALGVSSFVAGPMGFTLEIGGFLAGLALSNLPEHLQIASRTKPLRDFFLTLFFVYLGTQLVIDADIFKILPEAIFLSIFVLIGNPLILLTILGLLGYKRRTSFLAGLTSAQISEFSLVLIAMGMSLGHVSQKEVSLVIMVGVITMTFSTYLIMGGEKIYSHFRKYLKIFERRKTIEDAYSHAIEASDHIALVGCDRTGRAIVRFLKRRAVPFLAVDFNPRVFTRLTAENIPIIFGDISDPEIIEAARIDKARMIISTIGNFSDNKTLLENINKLDKKPVTIFTTATKEEAIKLYEFGASYVIVPEIIAGDHIKHLLRVYGLKGERLTRAGKSHFNRLIFT